ncbi:MAG: LamG domain-containing protein [Bacteroidia bacterium]
MPNGVMAVGRGTFMCTIGTADQSQELLLHAAIAANGIQWFKADEPSKDLSKLLVDNGANVSGTGQIVLTSLPATPHAAFYDVQLVGEADQYSIIITQSDAFGAVGFPALKDLSLTFTKRKRVALKVSGSLKIDILGETLELQAQLQDGGLGFFFADPPPFEPPQLEAIASLDFLDMKVGAPVPGEQGLQHRYDFTELSPTEVTDSAGSPAPLPLLILAEQVSRKANKLTITPASRSEDRKVIYMQSSTPPEALVDACQATNEITVAAWIQPTKSNQKGPGRIVSLSESTSKRNFHLGHGPQSWSNDPGTFVGFRLRTDHRDINENGRLEESGSWGGGSHAKREPIASTPGSIDTSLQYVVVTRKADGTLSMYINGILVNQTLIEGTFVDWDKSFFLNLGNEAKDDRSWAGSYRRIAIYNKALPESEVQQGFFPLIEVQGEGILEGFPAPLNTPLTASLRHELREAQAANILRLELGEAVTMSKNWKVDSLISTWQIAPILFLKGESRTTHSLWAASVEFALDIEGNNKPVFLRNTPTQKINIGNSWSWTGNNLHVSATGANWIWQGDGEVTNLFLPDPQAGPMAAMPVWSEDRLWLALTAGPTQFAFIDRILLETRSRGLADLKLGPIDCKDALWATLTKAQSEGNPPNNMAVSFNVLHASIEAQSVLAEAGSRATLFEGDWQKDDAFDLSLAMAFSWKGREHFGNAFNIEGDLHYNGDEDFIQYLAEGSLFFTQDGAVLSEGETELYSLGKMLFKGDLEYLGDLFESDGQWDLFEDWSACQVFGPMTIELNNEGIQGEGPIVMEVPNLPVEEPWLHIENGDVAISGDWLGEGWRWQTEHLGDELVLVAHNDMIIMGNFEVGPIYDPVSGAMLADSMLISPNPRHRQAIQVSFTSEINQNGFLGRIEAKVPWEDAHGRVRMLNVPSFVTYDAPSNRSEILELIATELQQAASNLLAPHVGEALEFRYDQNMRLSLHTAGGVAIASHTVELPALFKADETLADEGGIFSLVQSGNDCSLTINMAADAAAQMAAFDGLLLMTESNANVVPGAVALLRQRMAEAMPADASASGMYHFGFNAEKRYVDVYPGMRLRVEYQNYQFVHPSDDQAGTGFIGSGSSFYDVVAKGANVGFDSFAGSMRPALRDDNTVAGLLDLQGHAYPYFRLFFPHQGGDNWQGAERATMLLGASSYQRLLDATNEYELQTKISDNDDWVKLSFRGKAVVVPEVCIFENEQAIYVPVGTTLRQVLHQSRNLAPSTLASGPVHEKLRIPPRRLVGNQYVHIHLAPYRFGNEQDSYDLPLVKGDRIFS